MRESETDLTVIVVIHDSGDMALATLRSAKMSCGPLEVQWLVVDSGSMDGTAERIEREWADVHVLRAGNAGFAAGNNRALERARGRYVLLLNPDVEIVRGTLAELVAALDARTGLGAASVIQLNGDGQLLNSIRRFPGPMRQLGEALFAARWPFATALEERERRAAEYATERSADWLVGAFLIVRKEAIASAGPLDERFFLYSEEADWCLRIRRAGWDVRHMPQLAVVHHQGGYERPELAAQLSYSKLLFARKHFSPLACAATRLALAAGHTLRIVLLVPRRGQRSRVRRELRALAVTVRVAPPPFP